MKKPSKLMIPHSLPAIAAVLLAAAAPARSAILVQELFDGIAGAPPGTSSTLDGKSPTSSSIGLAGNWSVNDSPATIFTASNFNVDSDLPGAASYAGTPGGLWRNGGNNWSTNIHAVAPLATTIDFNNDQTLYFSVRLKNSGDTSMGIGLVAGSGASAEFVGAGFSWSTATSIDGASGDANNAAYTSHGTLGANSGIYGIRAHEAANNVNGFGLLIGRITISSSGADLIDIVRYAPDSTIDADPSSVTWSASSSYDPSMVASHLLLWLNGSGDGKLDAIRFGESWADVTAVPEPAAATLDALGALALLRRRRA